MSAPDLRDDLIVLRLPCEADVEAITAACQDPDIPRFTRVPSPYARADAVQFVANTAESWRVGASREFVICDVHTGVLRSYATIGCGLADVVMFSLLPGDLA